MRGVTRRINDRHGLTPGRAGNPRGSLSHRGKRHVRGPVIHPVSHRGHRGRTHQQHEINIRKVGKTLHNGRLVLRQPDREGRPGERPEAELREPEGEPLIHRPGPRKDHRVLLQLSLRHEPSTSFRIRSAPFARRASSTSAATSSGDSIGPRASANTASPV